MAKLATWANHLPEDSRLLLKEIMLDYPILQRFGKTDYVSPRGKDTTEDKFIGAFEFMAFLFEPVELKDMNRKLNSWLNVSRLKREEISKLEKETGID